MPPKQVHCSICGAFVLKAQTVARADGTRACRVHEEAAGEAAARKVAERIRLDVEIKVAAQPKFVHHDLLPTSDELAKWREHVYSHCWVCDRGGVGLRDLMLERLVAMKRLELRGEWNFWTLHEDIVKLTGEWLALLDLELRDEVVDKAIVKHVHDRRLRGILHFIGHVILCPDCARKHGFWRRWKERVKRAEPTWEQVEAFMPIMVMVEPVLREAAEKKERQN